MSDTDKIANLEKRVFLQDQKISTLEQNSHKVEVEFISMINTLKRVDESQIKLNETFEKYVNKGEQITEKFYNKFNSLDDELKLSFKERDEKIVELRIGFAKMLAYATVVFTVITFIMQVLISRGIL